VVAATLLFVVPGSVFPQCYSPSTPVVTAYMSCHYCDKLSGLSAFFGQPACQVNAKSRFAPVTSGMERQPKICHDHQNKV